MEETNMFSTDIKPTLIDIYFDLFLKLQGEVGDDIVLKGNVLLNKLLPDTARSTVDLDASITGRELYYTSVVPILETFCKECLKDKLADSYVIRDIQERKSGGVDLSLGGSKVLSVDISLRSIKSPYNFKKYIFILNEVYGSSIEKIVADKCLSTLSRKRFRRAKDFYDLYIIKQGITDINYKIVKELMIEKVGIDEVNSLLDNYPFSEEIYIQLQHAWSKLSLENVKGEKIKNKPTLAEIINWVSSIYTILKEVV